MRILILTQFFTPEIGGPQARLSAMAAELKNLGHEVEVVTGFPNYPRGKFFSGYEYSFYRREVRDGVIIHRVWLYPAMGGGLKRLLNYMSFTVTSVVGLLRAKNPDYIFVESPPLFLALPAYIIGRLKGFPFIFNVADLWPDAVVQGGFVSDGFVLWCLKAFEKWSYRKAAYVNAVTDGIRTALLKTKLVPPEKVLFLPNGVDTIRFQPRPEAAGLRNNLGLEGKKIVLWAGTLGYAHGLENVLQAARILNPRGEIHFLFIGDGSAKRGLEELARNMNLANVSFRDSVPSEQLAPYFSLAACGLSSLLDIPLHDGARPSKMFPVLASGKPLIFVGRGEGARLVQNAGAGIVVAPGDPEALAAAIVQMAENPEAAREFGKRGREYVEKNMQWSQLISTWAKQLESPSAQRQISTDLSNA